MRARHGVVLGTGGFEWDPALVNAFLRGPMHGAVSPPNNTGDGLRMAMAHGVESRVPFLDHPLVEFAASVPADVKFRNGELKRLLKHVYAPRLPAAIRERKDKMGFPVPLTNWLRQKGPAAEFVRDVFASRAAKERSYLARPVDLDQVLSGQSVYSRNLWALLSLELWHQAFVDKAAS